MDGQAEITKNIYKYLCYIGYISSIINLIFVPYFIRVLWKAQLMHCNLRYLLGVTVFSLFAPGFIRSTMDLIHFKFPNYLQLTCLILDTPYSFFNGTASMAFLLIFIERFCATKRSDTYENNHIPLITFFTIALFLYGLLFVSLTIWYDKSTPPIYPLNEKSCLSLERRYWAIIIGWTVYFLHIFPIIPSMYRLAQQNLRMLRSPTISNLSTRYQQNENLKALRAIVNSFVVSNLIFGGAGLGAFAFILYVISVGIELDCRILVASKILNLSLDVGCLFFALTLLILHPTLDRRVHSMVRIKKIKYCQYSRPGSLKRVGGESEAEIYFRDLALTWNK